MSGRDCSYVSEALENRSTAGTSSREPSTCEENNHSQRHASRLNLGYMAAVSRSNLNSPGCSRTNNQQSPALEETINFNHMELLIHLIFDKDVFELGGGISDSDISIALKTGLEAPYLLHQLLAFSARHLAFRYPERRDSYLRQAVILQTNAVSLFNGTSINVNESNCVATLLFSTILGHQLLVDTLVKRGPGGLDAFITQYVHFLKMHRGIYTIASTAWPLLMESELEPILSLSSVFTSRAPRGNDCQQIVELVDGADDLGDEDKEACQLALKYLQIGFDAVFMEEKEIRLEKEIRYQMIFSWTMLAPPGFTSLLETKRPEVLVILGYYALLLHYGRKLWQVGNAGAYILGIIMDDLGLEWHRFLEYPRQRITGDVQMSSSLEL